MDAAEGWTFLEREPATRRVLRPDEFACLKKRARVDAVDLLATTVVMMWCLGLAGILLVGLPLGALAYPDEFWGTPILIGLGVGCAAAVVLVAFGARSGEPCRRLARADLEARRVEVYEVEPIRFADVSDDLGVRFLFQIEERVVLLLQGETLSRLVHGPGWQRLDEEEASKRRRISDFPTARFEVARAPRSGIVLGIEALGDRLAPSPDLSLKSGAPELPCFPDMAFIARALDEICHDQGPVDDG